MKIAQAGRNPIPNLLKSVGAPKADYEEIFAKVAYTIWQIKRIPI
jgi:hypothetical protein